jgi:hypothetical protein
MTIANPVIDFGVIAHIADLTAVITADLGPPARGGKWLCPYHDDHRPSLAMTPDKRHWRCWACGEHGDALDWLAKRDGIDLVEAARRLDPSAVGDRSRAKSPTAARGASAATRPMPDTSAAPEPAWRNPEWQATVDQIITEAEAVLWTPDGRRALRWLRSRGMADHTIKRFRLGFNPRDFRTAPIEVLGRYDRGEPRRICVRRGVTIPWVAPGATYAASVECDHRWVGANVRRLGPDHNLDAPLDPRYWALTGPKTRGYLYPWADILPTQGIRPALLVEGELDAVLAEQEAGNLVLVGSIGGATQHPDRSALVALAQCPVWLVATDHDAAGVEAARAWRDRAPHKARRVMLPHGKDVGEFVQKGGDRHMAKGDCIVNAAELLAVHILDAALRRAHEAADLVAGDYPKFDWEITFTYDVGRINPADLSPLHVLVVAAGPGASKSADLLPCEATITMARAIRAAAEAVSREVARLEAEHAAENAPELPADVDPDPDWPPLAGRSATPEDFTR